MLDADQTSGVIGVERDYAEAACNAVRATERDGLVGATVGVQVDVDQCRVRLSNGKVFLAMQGCQEGLAGEITGENDIVHSGYIHEPRTDMVRCRPVLARANIKRRNGSSSGGNYARKAMGTLKTMVCWQRA